MLESSVKGSRPWTAPGVPLGAHHTSCREPAIERRRVAFADPVIASIPSGSPTLEIAKLPGSKGPYDVVLTPLRVLPT